ncbi:hypothetical protein [Pseudoalteromonas sp. SCSIO 43101]|uniref:hypothetical protein n=1 Tax=Pseudoalteromonas sp. SCSIO 43101 TaxID=2822847 RepID=UPI00202B1B21|nr:hypothetical protein [Pseudoalteromonas sp. SCSIO 43101]URQ89978.1 hypothetical protein J8Z25_14640 [Pseudoalteromonas sp. SCSIO 43101]
MKSRDDFSKATKKELAERVGHLCSNPECRVLTKGAKTDSNGTVGIGVAAHITAAAIGGPRYDASLTKQQRKSFDNGIWLCQSCARIIDVDVAKYSVSLLKSWRAQAEEFSNTNIGKKIYDEHTVKKEIIKSTIEHISGWSGSSSSDLAIKAIQIKEAELSSLDSRFNVTTNIIDGKVSSLIEPKYHDIELKIAAADKNDDTLYSCLLGLEEEGREFSIDTSKINISGSPLFEQMIARPGGVFQAGAVKQKIQCELYATNNDENLFLASCRAHIYGGTKKTIIEGLALNSFLSFSTEMSDISKSTFSIRTSSWLGKKLSKLPFFPKLIKAIDILSKSGKLKVVHDHPELGEIIIAQTNLSDKGEVFIGQVVSLLKYVHKARIVNNYLNSDLTYQYFNASEEEVKALDELSDLIGSPVIITADQIESNPKLKVLLCEGFCEDESFIGTPNTCIRIYGPGSLKQLFNQAIPEYFIRHQYNNVGVATNEELIENTEVELELQMSDSSQYIKSVTQYK